VGSGAPIAALNGDQVKVFAEILKGISETIVRDGTLPRSGIDVPTAGAP
jgi:hypothetical protein